MAAFSNPRELIEREQGKEQQERVEAGSRELAFYPAGKWKQAVTKRSRGARGAVSCVVHEAEVRGGEAGEIWENDG